MGRLEPTCGSMSAWAMLSTSARRAEASFCSPESGPSCCSARESERRLFWRCCTRWRRPTRHGRSCGCTRLAIGQHHPFAAEVRRLMLALSHGRSYVCYSRPGSRDRMGEDFDAAGHLSRSVFDEVGLPREADIYLCGPTRFMAEMKDALAPLGVAPERIHVELFNGSESMTPGVVGAATRAPHLPKDDANTGPLVSFARSGIAAHWKASAYQSILELAEACDVPVRWSCRTGVCHNCESGLVSGIGRLRTGATRKARRRQRSRLLLTTDSRCRHRSVKRDQDSIRARRPLSVARALRRRSS